VTTTKKLLADSTKLTTVYWFFPFRIGQRLAEGEDGE
jgi:hypothetical protein